MNIGDRVESAALEAFDDLIVDVGLEEPDFSPVLCDSTMGPACASSHSVGSQAAALEVVLAYLGNVQSFKIVPASIVASGGVKPPQASKHTHEHVELQIPTELAIQERLEERRADVSHENLELVNRPNRFLLEAVSGILTGLDSRGLPEIYIHGFGERSSREPSWTMRVDILERLASSTSVGELLDVGDLVNVPGHSMVDEFIILADFGRELLLEPYDSEEFRGAGFYSRDQKSSKSGAKTAGDPRGHDISSISEGSFVDFVRELMQRAQSSSVSQNSPVSSRKKPLFVVDKIEVEISADSQFITLRHPVSRLMLSWGSLDDGQKLVLDLSGFVIKPLGENQSKGASTSNLSSLGGDNLSLTCPIDGYRGAFSGGSFIGDNTQLFTRRSVRRTRTGNSRREKENASAPLDKYDHESYEHYKQVLHVNGSGQMRKRFLHRVGAKSKLVAPLSEQSNAYFRIRQLFSKSWRPTEGGDSHVSMNEPNGIFDDGPHVQEGLRSDPGAELCVLSFLLKSEDEDVQNAVAKALKELHSLESMSSRISVPFVKSDLLALLRDLLLSDTSLSWRLLVLDASLAQRISFPIKKPHARVVPSVGAKVSISLKTDSNEHLYVNGLMTHDGLLLEENSPRTALLSWVNPRYYPDLRMLFAERMVISGVDYASVCFVHDSCGAYFTIDTRMQISITPDNCHLDASSTSDPLIRGLSAAFRLVKT